MPVQGWVGNSAESIAKWAIADVPTRLDVTVARVNLWDEDFSARFGERKKDYHSQLAREPPRIIRQSNVPLRWFDLDWIAVG